MFEFSLLSPAKEERPASTCQSAIFEKICRNSRNLAGMILHNSVLLWPTHSLTRESWLHNWKSEAALRSWSSIAMQEICFLEICFLGVKNKNRKKWECLHFCLDCNYRYNSSRMCGARELHRACSSVFSTGEAEKPRPQAAVGRRDAPPVVVNPGNKNAYTYRVWESFWKAIATIWGRKNIFLKII